MHQVMLYNMKYDKENTTRTKRKVFIIMLKRNENFADYANRPADEVVNEMVENDATIIYFDDKYDKLLGLNLNGGLIYKRNIRVDIDAELLNEDHIDIIDELVEEFVVDASDIVFTAAFFMEGEDGLFIDVWENYDWDEGDAPLVKDITHEVERAVAFITDNAGELNNMLVANVK